MEGSEPGGGENTHKLLERFEWLAEVKLEIHTVNVDKIGSEGGEMVRVVPLP
jgi:hypothetical protein